MRPKTKHPLPLWKSQRLEQQNAQRSMTLREGDIVSEGGKIDGSRRKGEFESRGKEKAKKVRQGKGESSSSSSRAEEGEVCPHPSSGRTSQAAILHEGVQEMIEDNSVGDGGR
ncbi:hypothetical protein NQZ68_000983, partial [Dissostichus eleginoides]